MKTGLVLDAVFALHDPGAGHPESPARIESIRRRLQEEGLLEKVRLVEARAASQEEICWIHSPEYLRRVEATAGRRVQLDPDTATSPESFRAASLAAGGTCRLVEMVVSGELQNGYALVRPPGHHAERSRAMGFCLFNNVAIGAEFARRRLGLQRVAIVDWDLHHGNGTMHSFWDDPGVLYFSTHQYPYYPGTGALTEIGEGKGEHFTVNVPLSGGMDDRAFRGIFRLLLTPILEKFSPELVLVSTGYDIYRDDPLGAMEVTEEGFGDLAGELLEVAERVCGGRLVLVLEGGYNLRGLAGGVACVVRTLLGEYRPAPFDGNAGRAAAVIEAAREVHGKFWHL